MRILFTSWSWPAHYLPMVPLATALRARGDEVLVATQPNLVELVAASGLPVVSVGTELADVEAMEGSFLRRASPPDRRPLEWADVRGYGALNCRKWVALAELMIDDLLAVGRAWRPDLIVFEPTTYAGPLAAAVLGVAAVRHTWGIDYTYYQREFEPEAVAPLCERFGLAAVETLGAVTVDPCPPSLQVAPDPNVPVPVRRIPMRHVPYNGAAVQPRWILDPVDRPRVCICWGNSSARWDPRLDLGAWMAGAIAELAVDVVLTSSIPVPEEIASLPNVRVLRQAAVQLLFPRSDVAVTHGGLGTLLSAMTAGIPQLVVPQIADRVLNARQLARTGASDYVFATECDEDGLRSAVDGLLSSVARREAAQRLCAESQALPGPDVVAEQIRALAD